MNMRPLLIAATMLLSSSLPGQTAAEHIVLGDREHAERNAAAALRHYQAAIAVAPNSAEALWRASREAIDLGEFSDAHRDSLYRLGEQYARHSVEVDSNSAMTRFALARALGRRALSLGARGRVRYAAEVRSEALASLAIDSVNPGALHVMGQWNASVMRLSGISRFLAKNLLGGKVFDQANWTDAIRYLERAVAIEPERIVHRLALAGVYADSGDKPRAREEYQTALRLAVQDYNDPSYQQQAEWELNALK